MSPTDPLPRSKHRLRIRIAGGVSEHWTHRFPGLELRESPEGDSLLNGDVSDEAALFGLLRNLEALGAPIVSIFTYPADGRRG